jgi:hypothetical protein
MREFTLNPPHGNDRGPLRARTPLPLVTAQCGLPSRDRRERYVFATERLRHYAAADWRIAFPSRDRRARYVFATERQREYAAADWHIAFPSRDRRERYVFAMERQRH